jgi:hypothetical protein
MEKQQQWQNNISKIELKMFLRAICKDPECFKKEIETRRNNIETEIPDHAPMSPTECLNTPNYADTPGG